ncbi:MAG: T9SS type A sorting domain-containing protein [Tannerella sp.]|nr:T9SS type A sorting domain-containing protein [Tannerella sp.]
MKYEAPTPDYDGSAELSIVGGSSQLQYLLGNGKWEYVYTAGLQGETWNPNADSIVPFTATQISNFPDVIYFKEPNTSTYREIRIRGEEYPVVPITPRLVTIPTVSGATLLPSGKVYVESGKDLELTITVDDVKKEPKLTADQGWEVEREYLGGNVYKYTIKRVTKATNIHVELVPAGISDVEGSSVWSAGGQIYVTAATAASAQIYGATGAVIKQVSLGAGETTSVSLPAGFYIVTLNGNAYKVILK